MGGKLGTVIVERGAIISFQSYHLAIPSAAWRIMVFIGCIKLLPPQWSCKEKKPSFAFFLHKVKKKKVGVAGVGGEEEPCQLPLSR